MRLSRIEKAARIAPVLLPARQLPRPTACSRFLHSPCRLILIHRPAPSKSSNIAQRSPPDFFQLPCSLPIVVECSPFADSVTMYAYGTESHVTVRREQVSTESDAGDAFEEIQYIHVADLHHGALTRCIAWSPLSTAPTYEDPNRPVNIHIAFAGADKKLYYYTVDPENTGTKVILGDHSSHINACAFSIDGTNPLLASTGDDATCRIFDVETQSETGFLQLKTAGVAVKFHPNSPTAMMVAERGGTIKIIDLRSMLPISTIYTDEAPLYDADWNWRDINQVGGVAGNRWYVWNTDPSTPDRIAAAGPANNQPSYHFRWSHGNGNVFSTASQQQQIVIWDHQHAIPKSIPVPSRVGNLSWMAHRDCIVSATQRKLHFALIGHN